MAHTSLENGMNRNPPPATGNFFIIAPAVLCPILCRSVTINSTNPLNPPVINLNYLMDAQDLTILNYVMQSVKQFPTARAWKGYILYIFAERAANLIKASAGM
ncbi:hypothetical protein EDD18DRAFT_1364027 [Armillaria luteobubalina]|uniref:Uncharacterized protein n=1 Tax=Armillaria luteobubalina TaxID=153913 RepID=A0AA39P946_9AGAR|nr:hypothetical protein EDD18DRAFT_1364027 [Armillaria luteobubalina]